MCRVCPIPQNVIELSNMSTQAIISHGSGKKHRKRLVLDKENSKINSDSSDQSSCFSVKGNVASSSSVKSGKTSNPSPVSATGKSIMNSFVIPDSVTDAEIRWTLKNVMSSFSERSSDGLSDLFKAMFPASAIAKKFCLQKDKCGYFINYGIAPHFRSVLVDDIMKSEFFAVSFDESLNEMIQLGQMDLVVNYWCDSINRVNTRYLDSTFMGHARSSDLLKHFLKASKPLNQSKLIWSSLKWAFLSE